MGAQYPRSNSSMYVELLSLSPRLQTNYVLQMRLPPPPTKGLGFEHGYYSLGGLRNQFHTIFVVFPSYSHRHM